MMSSSSETSNRDNGTGEPYQVLLFYKFVDVPNPELILKEQQYLCNRLGLLGRIIIANEGINGTLSGPKQKTECYIHFMEKHPLFAHMEFKIDLAPKHSFPRLSIRVRSEIVHFGCDMPLDPIHQGGKYIEPEEMRDLLRNENEDVIILDTRSRYEHEIGKFKGAITLDINTFRELPQSLESLAHLKSKKIVTYCTGGIRCEKVTAYMRKIGFENVYQLHGGIIRYAQEVGGENFEGLCYVFDERIAIPVNTVNPKIISRCIHCNMPAEKMINCANAACNEQIIVCPACAEKMEGCCSEKCKSSEQRRVFDGRGQYIRGENSKNYVAQPTIA
jgi:UPF0176 protein